MGLMDILEQYASQAMAPPAAMNVWLHREVVAKLAANGGRVPDSMKA